MVGRRVLIVLIRQTRICRSIREGTILKRYHLKGYEADGIVKVFVTNRVVRFKYFLWRCHARRVRRNGILLVVCRVEA